MRYVMKNEGYATFKQIYKGRAKVGRVWRHADGHFVGMIGKIECKGASEREAFDAVVAADCGFGHVNDLRAHNSSVRAANRRSRAEAYDRAMQDPALRSIFEAIADITKAMR